MRRLVLFTAGLLLVAPASPALTQTLYLQAGTGLEIRRLSAERGEEVFDAQVPNVLLSLGGFLTPRVSAGIEFDASRVSSEARTVGVTLAGRPETITTTYRLRRRSFAALAGLHTSPARMVRFSGFAGVAFTAARREVSSDAPAIVLTEPLVPAVFLDRTTSAIVGADVAVHVAPGVAVVATLRAQGLVLAGDAAGFSVRPGGGVRISF